MNSKKYIPKKAFFTWLSCMAIPFVLGNTISIVLIILYIFLIFITYNKVGNGVLFLWAFIFLLFSLPYSFIALFSNGQPISKSLLIGWINFIIKFVRNNLFVSIILLTACVAVSTLYEPQQINLSDLEIIEQQFVDIDRNLIKEIYPEIDELELQLKELSELSAQIRYSKDYQVYLSQSPDKDSWSNEKIDELSNKYWELNNRTSSNRNTANNYSTKKTSYLEKISILEEDYNRLKNSLDKSCLQIDNVSDNIPEKLLSEKRRYCSFLEEKFIKFNSRIIFAQDKLNNDLSRYISDVYTKISESRTYISQWKDWIKNKKNITETISLSQIESWIDSSKESITSAKELIDGLKPRLEKLENDRTENISRFTILKSEYIKIKSTIDYNAKANIISEKAILNATIDKSFLVNSDNRLETIKIDFQTLIEEFSKHIIDLDSRISNINYYKQRGRHYEGLQAEKKEDELLIKSIIKNQFNEIDSFETNKLTPFESFADKKKEENQKSVENFLNEVKKFSIEKDKMIKDINFYIQEAEFAIFIERLIRIFISIACVLIVGVISFYLHNKRRIKNEEEIAKEGTSKLLEKWIMKSNKLIALRLYAIELIYKKQSLLSKDDINNLKEAIRKLEKSSTNEDIKVAARLREITLAMELRFMEQRSIN